MGCISIVFMGEGILVEWECSSGLFGLNLL